MWFRSILLCMNSTRACWEDEIVIVRTYEEVAVLRSEIIRNAEATCLWIQEKITTMGPMRLFAAVKFEKVGRSPVGGKELNLIEQINQTFSDLVVLAATEDLMERFHGKAFDIQLGVSAGHDVRSTDGMIAAECFAVTTISSNDKLNEDCKKLMASEALIKCVYFYSNQDTEKKIQNRVEKYPEIQIKRISFEELKTSTSS